MINWKHLKNGTQHYGKDNENDTAFEKQQQQQKQQEQQQQHHMHSMKFTHAANALH